MDAEGYRQAGSGVHEALQEALVNALIHADHFGQGGVVVDRYIDRFEFSNPGTLLVSREQLLKGGISECRNKSLQRMFQMLGVGDKAGSGIDRIRTNWAAQHWSSPRLRETHRPDRVELLLPMVTTLPAGAVERLTELFGGRFSALTPDEVQALVAAEAEGEVTNQRLQEMLALHRVDITKLLRGLVQAGLLDARGVGRGTRYVVHRPIPPRNGVMPPEEGEASVDPRLVAISDSVRRTRRTSTGAVGQVVLALCAVRPLRLRDLAGLLQRHPETVRARYVGPLVAAGLLMLEYPDQPSHRDQRYRAQSAAVPEAPPDTNP